MTRRILISIIVVGWIVASIQLIRTVFSTTLDHGVLSIASITLGLLLATGLKVVFSKRKVAFNWPIAAFVLVFLSTTDIALLNYQLASSHDQKKDFIVKGSGERAIRYNLIEYVVLTDGNVSFTFTGFDKESKPRAGDALKGVVRKGFFGFDIVEIEDQS